MATVDNPLSDIRVGSSVDTAGKFSATVLEPESQITDMVAEYDDEKTMRGQSDLLYTTGMNQASASMSGLIWSFRPREIDGFCVGLLGQFMGATQPNDFDCSGSPHPRGVRDHLFR